MIDEELYRLAQDELNSDQRRSNIWARACALARDDHDEARYLYTNLRVEEMIAERDKLEQQQTSKENEPANTPTSNKPKIRIDPAVLAQANEITQNLPETENGKDVRLSSRAMADELFGELDTSAMEQFDSTTEEETGSGTKIDLSDEAQAVLQEHVAAQRSLSDEDREKINSTPLSFEEPEKSTDEPLPFEEPEKSTDEPLPFEEPEKLVEEPLKFDAPLDTPTGDELSIDELDLDQFDDDVYNATTHRAKIEAGGRPTNVESADNESSAGSGLDELDDLVFDDTLSLSKPTPPATTAETDAMESHAEDHPLADVRTSDYGSEAPADPLEPVESLAALEARAREEAETLTDGPTRTPVDPEQALVPNQGFGPGISHDYADNRHLESFDSSSLEQEIDSVQALALNSGSGSAFIVFSDENGRTKAVKNGVSWSAFFLTLPWLLSKKLLGTAVVYTLLWLVVLGGLLITGLAWMDAGSAATTVTKVATGLFALMAIIGLFYVPFRFGNSWVANKLVKKGYDYQTPVRAKNRKQAIDKVLRFAT